MNNINFVDAFITSLSAEIPLEYLEPIKRKLIMFSSEYSIKKKSTNIVISNMLPEEYKIYMVQNKIEGMSDKSLEQYKYKLEKFITFVNKPLDKIHVNDVRIFLYHCQKTMSNRTVDNIRSIIHSFLEWCANEGYIGANPCRTIKPLKYQCIRKKPLTGDEFEVIISSCKTLRDKAMMLFIYSTGVRVSELCDMNIQDINMDKREAIVRHGKGNKMRTVYFDARTKNVLSLYLQERNDNEEVLFAKLRNNPSLRMSKSGVEAIFRKIKNECCIQTDFTPHILRHTIATNSLRKGMDVTEVQKMLGHSNISTTMIYCDVDQETVRDSYNKHIS